MGAPAFRTPARHFAGTKPLPVSVRVPHPPVRRLEVVYSTRPTVTRITPLAPANDRPARVPIGKLCLTSLSAARVHDHPSTAAMPAEDSSPGLGASPTGHGRRRLTAGWNCLGPSLQVATLLRPTLVLAPVLSLPHVSIELPTARRSARVFFFYSHVLPSFIISPWVHHVAAGSSHQVSRRP